MGGRSYCAGFPGIVGVTVVALLTRPGAALGEDSDEGPLEKVYYDVPDEQGQLSGGFTLMPVVPTDPPADGLDAPVTTIMDNGPPANRIDLVFVGDGYLETELDLYAVHVNNCLFGGPYGLFAEEPFATYMTLFNVYQVDVVSNESGVDGDPTKDIERDTALDMGFTGSHLYVDTGLAHQYAANAPDVDHVFAVANSRRYGGAAFSYANTVTFAGYHDPFAAELAIHEFGHILGRLADEYFTSFDPTYEGPEPTFRNISILDADAMAAAGTKWAPWLGRWNGILGEISTYEGAYYHQYGIYRPTFNSKMRILGKPFNLPSVEGLILEIYGIVDPIDDATVPRQTLAGTETVFVDPVDPIGHALDVQWFINGVALPGATEPTLDLASLGLGMGAYELTVRVTDPTPLVRDEAARAAWMTQTLIWEMIVTVPGDVNGDFRVDIQDFLVLFAMGPCPEPCPPTCQGDIDQDCTVGIVDFLIMVANWS
jgi:hypothetical protein